MTLQAKLDAFKADFEAGKPPYSVPRSVIETMHRATKELISSGAAQRALKAGDKAPSFTLKDPENATLRSAQYGRRDLIGATDRFNVDAPNGIAATRTINGSRRAPLLCLSSGALVD